MNLRDLKALEIAARAKIAFRDVAWIVPSQTSNASYRVILGPEPSCHCDDFQLQQQPCKHIIAARLVCAREQPGQAGRPAQMDTTAVSAQAVSAQAVSAQAVPAQAVSAQAVPKKPTFQQNWPMYNEAQQTEKYRFQKLLFELCRGLPTLEQTGGGRRWTPLADMIFACALKVYTTVSARRFACDLKTAHAAGLLSRLMNSVSVCAFLENPRLTPILQRLIVQSSLPLSLLETTFAPDSSGFSTSRFVRWHDEKYGCERSGHDWVKAHAICGVKTNIVTAVQIGGRDAADSPFFRPLVEQTATHFTIKEVPADKAYLSHDNLAAVDALGGTAYVPYKLNSQPGQAGSLWEKMYFYFQYRRQEFLQHYHQRSNIESTFAMVKAKFRDHVRSKTDVAMHNEVLCKFLCHNLCVVHQAHIELGVAPLFWKDQATVPAKQSHGTGLTGEHSTDDQSCKTIR